MMPKPRQANIWPTLVMKELTAASVSVLGGGLLARSIAGKLIKKSKAHTSQMPKWSTVSWPASPFSR